MKEIIQKYFDIDPVEIKKLNGYDNQNFLVKTESKRFIFKTYLFDKELNVQIESEIKLLLYLHQKQIEGIPEPIAGFDGQYQFIISLNGEKVIIRLLSFLEGTFLADADLSEDLLRSFGRFLANLDKSLMRFSDHAIKSREFAWDLQYFHLNKNLIEHVDNPSDRSLLEYFFQQFEQRVRPRLPTLRRSYIHNDANEWNVLADNGQVSGIIDFGDLAYTPLINELAIALTYVCYLQDKGLEPAIPILQAYHQVLPLEPQEISILYYLIAARLCTSICNAALAKKEQPENEYAGSSEAPAWKMLRSLLRISPQKVKNDFLNALNMPVKKVNTIEKSISDRHKFYSPVLSLSYDEPIQMVRSAFQYMYDSKGNTFLDAYNNIPHVGHCHPKVVEAGQKQMARLNTNTRYHYDLLVEYADKLLEKFPLSLNKLFLVNSGSAASDLAIRMAKFHTKREKVLVMEQGYHGNTQTAIDISHYKYGHKKGTGEKEWIIRTDIPDTFRGKFKDPLNAGALYAKDAIQSLEGNVDQVAAFISEPIVGCAGQVPLAPGYLKELYPALKKHNILCISDEVQTGFGRVGDNFWGFEKHGVVPDIVILGKPMANGHPMGAVVTTSEIAESFGEGVEFFSSFGGNPVSCAIGKAVLEVIEDEGLQENAKVVGNYYKSLFEDLKSHHKCIGDVRGSGLFLGIELVEEDTLNPNTELAHFVKNEMRRQHILISTDGPHDNVLKTKPPLIFNKNNADAVAECLDTILRNYN